MSLKRAMPAIFALMTLAGCMANAGNGGTALDPPEKAGQANPANAGERAGTASGDGSAKATALRTMPVARPRPEPPARPARLAASKADSSAPSVSREALAKAQPDSDAAAEIAVAGEEVAPTAPADGSDSDESGDTDDALPSAGEAGEPLALEQDDGGTPDSGEAFARPKRRLEDRSLNCDVVELMGQAIGRWRLQGDERKPATDKAIDDVVRLTGAEKDEKFVFSGRVYGMLIYQIEPDHTVEGFGAYAQAACLILRGKEGIVPADDASQKRLDQSLSACEADAGVAADLTGCVYERMKLLVQEVDRRGG